MADENESERDDEETRDEDEGDGDDESAAAPATGSSASGTSDESDEDDGDDGDDEEPEAAAPASKAKASASADDDGGEPSEDELARREKREAEQAAREAEEQADHPAAASITALLGVERWVQFAFICAGVVLFFLADNLVRFVWSQFGEPDGGVVSAVAAATAVLGAFALYRHPQVNQLATEVITELRDVTWPTRDEVYYSTIVVIVTSVVAAVYTGLFDAFWSALTNVVYG